MVPDHLKLEYPNQFFKKQNFQQVFIQWQEQITKSLDEQFLFVFNDHT